MRIGIDFDNTIAHYDAAFKTRGTARGWLREDFSGDKRAVRTAIRRLPDGEIKWQTLQADVYGRFIGLAVAMRGFEAFLVTCRIAGAAVSIVSHKTQYAMRDHETDLRAAALGWLDGGGFFDSETGISRTDVHFENTLTEKVARIAALGCTHFVDDMEEIFLHPDFPNSTRRILLGAGPSHESWQVCPDWISVSNAIFH